MFGMHNITLRYKSDAVISQDELMRIYIQLKRIEVNRVLFKMPNGIVVENCQTCAEKCWYIGIGNKR